MSTHTRTISLRLDAEADATLRRLCEARAQSQTDVIREALQLLARTDTPTPQELASRAGLIGAFAGAADLSTGHARTLKAQFAARRAQDERPVAAPRKARRV